MKSDILNALDCVVTPGFVYGEASRVQSLPGDEKRRTVGVTIYIPTRICEFVEATLKISFPANAAVTVGTHSWTNSFVLMDAQDNRFSCEVPLERLAVQRPLQPAA